MQATKGFNPGFSASLHFIRLEPYGFIPASVNNGKITFYTVRDRSKVRLWLGGISHRLGCLFCYPYKQPACSLDCFQPVSSLAPRDLFLDMSRLLTRTSISSWRFPNCRLIYLSSVTQIRCNTSLFGSQTQAWSYVKQQTLDESSSKVCLIFHLL